MLVTKCFSSVFERKFMLPQSLERMVWSLIPWPKGLWFRSLSIASVGGRKIVRPVKIIGRTPFSILTNALLLPKRIEKSKPKKRRIEFLLQRNPTMISLLYCLKTLFIKLFSGHDFYFPLFFYYFLGIKDSSFGMWIHKNDTSSKSHKNLDHRVLPSCKRNLCQIINNSQSWKLEYNFIVIPRQ